MLDKSDKGEAIQTERQTVREQRKEFERELAEQQEHLPRSPRNRQRTIVLSVLAIIVGMIVLFLVLVLLPAPTQSPTAGIAIGSEAPNFALPIYGGGDGQGHQTSGNGRQKVDLRSLRGRPVVLNFWSESCTPCRAEMPYLQRLYSQYGQRGDFVLLGINQADPNVNIGPFGQSYHITYPLLFDKDDMVNRTYNVTSIPTTYFIDKSGRVQSVMVTQLSDGSMRKGLSSIGVQLP